MLSFAIFLAAATQPEAPLTRPSKVLLGPTSVNLPLCSKNFETEPAVRRDNVAVIRVILPKPFSPSSVRRQVYFESRLEEPFNPDDAQHQDYNDRSWVGNPIYDPENRPFKVNIDAYSNIRDRYILVRFIIPEGSDVSFWSNSSTEKNKSKLIHGVSLVEKQGSNQDGSDKKLICGQFPIELVKRNGVKQVASFMIDTSLRGKKNKPGTFPNRNISFNLVIVADSIPDEPWTIDPKVHDTGVN